MTDETIDTFNRTAKIELDSGRAASPEEAYAIVRGYRLQVDVAPGIEASLARQSLLLTAINAGRRAFIGGVAVRTHDNPTLVTPWARGVRLRDAVAAFGGALVDRLDDDVTTIVVGDLPAPATGPVLYATFNGWSGGVVQHRSDRLAEVRDFALAGTLAGGLAVSEAFQAVRGDALAGRRDVGLSLWRPEVDWRTADGAGVAWTILPARLWLLGLGHLGQASAWTVGSLPFADPSEVVILVQDVDRVVEANQATGLLVPSSWASVPKTRLVAHALDQLGFQTLISERCFDENTRRRSDEPGIAIAGFDRPEPRRALEGAGFDYAIDLGLGGGPAHYLDVVMHEFPSSLSSVTAFAGAGPMTDDALLALAGYRHWQHELEARGAATAEQIKCGLLEIAGRTAGAAFVGTVAAAFGVAEAIRCLMDGPHYEIVDISLRSPQYLDVVPNTRRGEAKNPGYTRALR